MIGIIGPGAVGHMLAFLIAKEAGQAVQMIGRNGPVAVDASIIWKEQQHHLSIDRAEGDVRLLFVVVKSYDLQSALQDRLALMPEGSVIIILGNGYLEPLLAPLRSAYPQLLFRKGLVTRGIKQSAERQYVIGDAGGVVWGDEKGPNATESSLLESLRPFGFRWTHEACLLRKEKWFFNTTLNTLAGVYRLPTNGDALRLFSQDLEALAQEVHRLGHELWPDWNPSWGELWLKLQRLIQATTHNENSMARDVRLGRPTEAEVLSGCLRLARSQASYPLLTTFHARILSL